ncbi:MAG: hypothetical protein HC772_00780 [Leptolyngbyaceae cyanobacterium CRU_2_3]|nr:hypothetical protein [Leptolyngbyaceae cyanobacterium CRU_2_3]
MDTEPSSTLEALFSKMTPEQQLCFKQAVVQQTIYYVTQHLPSEDKDDGERRFIAYAQDWIDEPTQENADRANGAAVLDSIDGGVRHFDYSPYFLTPAEAAGANDAIHATRYALEAAGSRAEIAHQWQIAAAEAICKGGHYLSWIMAKNSIIYMEPFNVTPETMLWLASSDVLADRAEQILWFESIGGRALTLASNFPYELWLDGRFVGDGGHRCAPGEALSDRWEMAAQATTIQVRLHWVDLNQTRVLYRCLFPDPFFAEVASVGTWMAYLDHSVQFASQCSAQLPRQNILLADSADRQPVSLQPAKLSSHWQVVRSPLQAARYVEVIPQPMHTQILPAQLAADTFQPQNAKDLALYVREQRPCPLQCDTYDLGQIALHRFEVDSGIIWPACFITAKWQIFLDVASTRFRAKVGLADAIAPHLKAAAPFGTRGCRYVHVLYPASDHAASDGKPGLPTVRAWATGISVAMAIAPIRFSF